MKKTERECVTLIDTYNNDGLTYEDYREDCEENDREPEAEDSNDYYEWLSDTTTRYWEDFQANLKYSKADYPLMITGSLGLWNGRPDMYPILVESEDWVTHYKNWKGEIVEYHTHHYDNPSILKAILKCLGSCDDIKVRFNDGVVEVDALHHDGTNCFYIRKLSKKGLAAVEAANNRGEDEYKPKDWWFSRIKRDELF